MSASTTHYLDIISIVLLVAIVSIGFLLNRAEKKSRDKQP